MSFNQITRADQPSPHAPATPDITLRRLTEGFRRRWVPFCLVLATVGAVGVVVTLTTRPVYEAAVKFPAPPGPPDLSVGEGQSAGGPRVGQLPSYETLPAQVEALASAPLLTNATEAAGISRPGTIAAVLPALDKDSGSLVVAVRGYSPNDVAALANAIPDAHLRMLVEARKQDYRRTLEQARREKAAASAAAAKADRQLLAFRAANPLAQFAAEREALEKAKTEKRSRIQEAKSAIASARAQAQVVRARLQAQKPYLIEETVLPNKRRQSLQEELDAADLERKQLLKDFRPASDEVMAVDSKIASLRALMAAEPESVVEKTRVPNERRAVLEAKLTDIETTLEANQAELREALALPLSATASTLVTDKLELQERQLVRDREATQTVYQSLAGRLHALEIASDRLNVPQPEFQFAAPPLQPVEPNTKRDLAITLILGFALATGTVLLLEYLDDRMYSVDDTYRVSALPNLGFVPPIPRREPRRLAQLPSSSMVAESYRSLRSAIGFAAHDVDLRRVLITSPNKGEGKTLTAINLATAMALDGKRVILVDADLRNPNVHRQLELTLAPGVEDVISRKRRAYECVRPSGVENLGVVCAGAAPDLPAEVLNSTLFSQLLSDLSELADIVVIDSPPCLPVVDPAILSTQVDGVVMVVRAGKTRSSELSTAEELLRRARARILGVVHNELAPGGGAYYRTYSYPGASTNHAPLAALVVDAGAPSTRGENE